MSSSLRASSFSPNVRVPPTSGCSSLAAASACPVSRKATARWYWVVGWPGSLSFDCCSNGSSAFASPAVTMIHPSVSAALAVGASR